MARKRIADLLKEEVEKSTDGTENGVENETVAPSTPSPSSQSDTSAAAQNNGKQPSTGATKRKRSPTKADLEATVAKLTAQLQETEAIETTHQEKVAQLKQDFEQKIDQLKTELADAKSTILKLVDNNANAKVLQEQVQSLQSELAQEQEKITGLQQDLQQIDGLKVELEKAQKRVIQQPGARSPSQASPSRPASKPMRAASRPAPLSLRKSTNSPQPVTIAKKQPEKFLSTESKFKRMRRGSIDRKQPTSKLSDSEIGWFD